MTKLLQAFASQNLIGSSPVRLHIANKPGRKVAFYQDACADFARMHAYDDLGGWGVVTIWEVTEV